MKASSMELPSPRGINPGADGILEALEKITQKK
jgi:hypothetical protein